MTDVLNSRVLVLNSGWSPIDVTTVYEAVCMLIRGRCRFLDASSYATYDFESWVETWSDASGLAKAESMAAVLRSPNLTLFVPEVIVCNDYHGTGMGRNSEKPKFSRRNIYLRDRNICQYCGVKESDTKNLNLDHVIPKSKGGEMSWRNIVLSCISCNDRKRDRTPKEAGMRLVRRPMEPSPGDLAPSMGERLKRKLGRNPPATWENFLGKMYWEVGLKS